MSNKPISVGAQPNVVGIVFGIIFLVVAIIVPARAWARPANGCDSGMQKSIYQGYANLQSADHNIGNLGVFMLNNGTYGCCCKEYPSGEFPINSYINYLCYANLWIGGIIGEDTLVSINLDDMMIYTFEMWPDLGKSGDIITRSNLSSRVDYDPEAVSEQDIICRYTDTLADPDFTGIDPFDNRDHIPLNIAICQSSYAWSYDYASDFILIDYAITNIGQWTIKDMYFGLQVGGTVQHEAHPDTTAADELCGFRRTVPLKMGSCRWEDSINIAWFADNDGDPDENGEWYYMSPTGVQGLRILRMPEPDMKYSYNWWTPNLTIDERNFGPRLAGTDDDPFRSFGSTLGSPQGDKLRYYVLSHPEFDYDQLFTVIRHTGEGFLSPPRPAVAADIADGDNPVFMLSCGPFDLEPGDTVPLTVAYVAGADFHVNARDFWDYFDPIYPWAYYSKLDFTDLAVNARWAAYVFDNPGWDTDNDGDAGRYYWSCYCEGESFCLETEDEPDTSLLDCCQKVYYAGDGVPDFRAAAPPPPPILRVYPEYGKVTLRWNGNVTENAPDFFTGEKDFEGYKVYFSEVNRIADYVLLTSFDLDDYKVIRFNTVRRDWEKVIQAITRDSLQTLYGRDFDPALYYNGFNYFTDPSNGDCLYFVPQGWNLSDLSNPCGIHKVYPMADRDDYGDTTEEGYQRYYEYEFVVDNLEPSRPYYFAVTAFDYGSLNLTLDVLETSPLTNAVREYPLTSAEIVERDGLGVIVYPNPYRIDGGYARAGYENRDRSKSASWSRLIHFANLPNICTIRIYSVDGDLIREIKHYNPEGGPESQHESWNVISRNTQAVVTGIYIWHVRSEMGDQIGKLVIMK